MSNLIKKIFLFITVVVSCLFISNFALANENNGMNMINNGVNGVRNMVGGAENMVEDAVRGTTTTVKDGLNSMGNVTQNTMHNTSYSASRTDTDGTMTRSATGTTTNTNNTMWTWFIVGIIALIVIGTIWYMVTRKNNSNR